MSYYLTKARNILQPNETFQQLSNDLSFIQQEEQQLEERRKERITLQDMYGDFNLTTEKSFLKRFEKYTSNLLNKEDCLFVISGVMAQSIALLIHINNNNNNNNSNNSQNNRTFLCHYSSHLLIAENNSYKELLNLQPIIIPRLENSLIQYPLSANDIIKYCTESSNLPSVIIIECPHRELGGKITPWEDLLQISEYCRNNNIKLHLDGARLWEATVAYNKSLSEICSLFDSVYVSFYKGLGGMTGAMLLGNSSFISESRIWLRRFGGNIFTSLPYAVSSWAGLLRNVNTFQQKTDRLKHVVRILTELFQQNIKDHQLIRFDPEIPQVSLIHVYIRDAPSSILLQIRDRVFSETSISCFTMLRSSDLINQVNSEVIQQSYFEFNMGPLNLEIPDEIWLQGWGLFLKYLQEYISSK